MDLKICTYNCCSVRSKFEIIKNLCKENFDIIFLQETLLTEEKLGLLDSIDSAYNVITVPAIYTEKVLTSLKGRPSGGMACVFKKCDDFSIECVQLNNRYMLINCRYNNLNIFFINVYMPYDNHTPECIDEYLQILASIETCLENTMYDALYICGDFNADPYSSRLWEHCRRFCTDLNLVCFDYELLSADSFTFISNNNLFCKWLDHVLGTKNCTFDVNKILIRNDIVGSDHLPIEFYVKIKSVISSSPTDDLHNNEESTYKPMYNSYVNFDSLSKDNIKLMSDKVAYNIKSCFDNLCVICTGEAICHNNDHMSIIDTSYDILVHEINTVMTDVRNGLQRNLSNNSRNNNNGDVSIDDINNNNNDNDNSN